MEKQAKCPQSDDLLNRVIGNLTITAGQDHRGEYTAWCPFHPDGQGKPPHQPNLRVSERGFFCHACGKKGSLRTLAESLGVTNSESPVAEIVYDYVDEENNLLFQVVRKPGKHFVQRRPDGTGGWIYNLDGVRRVLYGLPEILAKPDETVFVVEGEKDADRLHREGLLATTNPGGAGKWKLEYSELLRDRNAVTLGDFDDSGRKHTEQVASSLHGIAASNKTVDLPGLPEKGDVSDWLNSGGTADELKKLAEAAPEWRPAVEQPEPGLKARGPRWPDPLGEKAYYGLAGEIVKAIEPHTEADPAALLFQFLTAFGNVIGRSAYFLAEADQHFMNLFTVQVGVTSRGRKGTSLGQVLRPFKMVDPRWISDRKQSGLSSGEGLIWGVRDQIEKTEPIKDNKQITGYQQVVIDEGITDKRLFVVEEEFAQTLRVLGREGNTLSPVIRNAWDSGNLSILTKNSPAKATGAHISIIGHITKDELLRYLDSTESGNGFANRFLWVCVKRSKVLPEGGKIQDVDFQPLVDRLNGVIEFARSVGEITRDESARRLWHRVYPELSEGKPGLFGSVTARAEAQVMRLACVYALLDRSHVIRREHLVAALEVWRYSEASAGFIFGDSLGDPVADELIRALRSAPHGMTRTEISNLFGRNKSSAEIGRALAVLAERNLARFQLETPEEGRTIQRWFLIQLKTSEPVPCYELDEINELSGESDTDISSDSFISYAEEDSSEDIQALARSYGMTLSSGENADNAENVENADDVSTFSTFSTLSEESEESEDQVLEAVSNECRQSPPERTCYTCGRVAWWWQESSQGWVCGVCHPKPD